MVLLVNEATESRLWDLIGQDDLGHVTSTGSDQLGLLFDNYSLHTVAPSIQEERQKRGPGEVSVELEHYRVWQLNEKTWEILRPGLI
jgi:hypothetical protein